MAKRRRRKQNNNLPKWVLSAFAAAAVILSVITFGGDMIGIDTSFAQECMNFIDRILYGGPTSPAPTLPASGELKVYVIDVGQGESILITTEENSLLIDAGENDKGDEVLDGYRARKYRRARRGLFRRDAGRSDPHHQNL